MSEKHDNLMKPQVTIDRIKELLNYDPETGIFTWKVSRGTAKAGSVAGSKHAKGYTTLSIDGKNYLAHRIAWLIENGEWPEDLIDHRNTTRNFNAIENLRQASSKQNNQNSNKKSKNPKMPKGVSKRRSGFRARIGIDGKDLYLGDFKTIEEASNAYNLASVNHFGEFAKK